MSGKPISKEQAKQFAYSFVGEISAYVHTHLAEYKAFLAEIGETDNTIFENNSEADNEKRTA